MSLNLSFKLLPILAIVLGIASIVAPRFLNVFVAIFLIAYGARRLRASSAEERDAHDATRRVRTGAGRRC